MPDPNPECTPACTEQHTYKLGNCALACAEIDGGIADQLEAAIAADCPDRLPDYLRHLATVTGHWGAPTRAFLVLWHEEHAISSDPQLEARLDRLYRAAQATDSPARADACLAATSRIRARVHDDVIKEVGDA